MRTQRLNNRFAGYRESRKIMPECRTAPADLKDIKDKISGVRLTINPITSAIVDIGNISKIMTARCLIEYIQENYIER